MRVAVTGAFGYSGRYIAQRFLAQGDEVVTLTNSPLRANPFGRRIRALPFCFSNPEALAESLRGVEVLVNTYWVRFDHRLFTHDVAVDNTRALFSAARQAGVRRLIHVSITNPDADSPLPYFKGKAQLEDDLRQSGLSYCILRPTVLFGAEDILINNIAWALRRFPVFGVFGHGEYRLQPIHVDDLAAAAVAQAASEENAVIQAIGPETFTYRGLVREIAETLGLRRSIVSVPPGLGYWLCWLVGCAVRDVVVTREEIQGLMEDRLFVDGPPLGAIRFSDWVREHRDTLGMHYASELSRRRDRVSSYRPL